MSADFMYLINHWISGLGLFAMMAVAYEMGYRRASRPRLSEPDVGQTAAIQASILGLLGLLLGFTLSMAVNRFELRNQLGIQEANTISSVLLRSRFWPETERAIRPLLARYVDLRLELRQDRYEPERLRAIFAESAKIHDELWKQAAELGRADSKSLTAYLFLQEVNRLIDLQTERLAAHTNHVPGIVLLLLDVLAIFSLGVVGYCGRLARPQRSGVALILGALICMVILVIMDLDRPNRGLIQKDATPLLEVREKLRSTAEPRLWFGILPRMPRSQHHATLRIRQPNQ